MEQMTIGDLIFAFALAVQLIIFCTVVLPNKRGKLGVFIEFVGMVIAYILLFACTYLDGVVFSFFVLYIDLFLPLICIAVCCSGNLWRNYAMLFAGYQVINYISSVLTVLVGTEETMVNTFLWIPLEMRGALLTAIIIITVSMGCALVFRAIIPKEYNGNGYIFIVADCLVIVALIVVFTLQRFMMDSQAVIEIMLFRYISVGVIVTTIICVLYYTSEKRRVRKEQLLLEQMITETYEQYAQVAKANQELQEVRQSVAELEQYAKELAEKSENVNLRSYVQESRTIVEEMVGIPLSGNPIIDAILSKYNKLSQMENVLLDVMTEPLDTVRAEDKEVVALIENLFQYIFWVIENVSAERWIVFRLSCREGVWIIKVLFSKAPRERINVGRNSIFVKREQRKQHMLYNIQKLIKMEQGTMVLKAKKEECEIDILLPRRDGDKR